jgi:hypothetical protein
MPEIARGTEMARNQFLYRGYVLPETFTKIPLANLNHIVLSKIQEISIVVYCGVIEKCGFVLFSLCQ